jgi:hypothetical protein
MSPAFRLQRVVVCVDGRVCYEHVDKNGDLSKQKALALATTSLPPGQHTLNALLDFRGNGYGVLTYMSGYRFLARSEHTFNVASGETAMVTVTAYERGGVTTPMEKRPAIAWSQTAVPAPDR